MPTFSTRRISTLRYVLLLSLALELWLSGHPAAQAQSITPAADGTGTLVSPNGNQLNISGGSFSADRQNLFHSFQQFGLSQGQIANFMANPQLRNILGRVTGGSPSIIDGLIQVTGGSPNLFLMNPAGIVFGANASLNVPAAFTATTANGIGIGNQWFSAVGSNSYATLTGNPDAFAFTTTQAGAIINAGNLAVGTGQSLSLLGGTVINTGTLTAPGGQIVVSAVPGENLVRVSQAGSVLSLEFQPLTANVPHAATIAPPSLPELLTGGNLSSATGLTVENGVVKLTSTNTIIPATAGTTIVSGRLSVASEGTGGSVYLLGDRVALLAANINASGQTGGGTVLIGGDYQGKGTVPNAKFSVVDGLSTIQANALTNGNGGKVVVWADQTTRFNGTIQAMGGTLSGNGGFAEVSGKQHLAFAGTVDLSAAQGLTGTLLLDPADITIVAGAAGSGANDTELADNSIFSPDGGAASFTISVGALYNSLLTASTVLEASNDITWDAGATLDYNGIGSFKTLEFRANRNITFSGKITDGIAGGDFLNVSFSGDYDTSGSGSIVVSNGAAITTNGGSLIFGSSNNPGTYAIDGGAGTGVDIAGNLDTGAGNISILGRTNSTGPAYGVFLRPTSSIDTTSGNVVIEGNNDNTTGPSRGTWISGTGITTTSGSISITGTSQGVSNVLVIAAPLTTGSGNITVVGTQTNVAGGSAAVGYGSTTTSSTGNISITGNAVATANNANGIQLNGNITTGGNITLTGSSDLATAATVGVNINGGTVASTGGGSITVVADKIGIPGGGISTTGTVQLKAQTYGRAIALGSGATDSDTQLGLDQFELNLISSPNIQVGDTYTGAVTFGTLTGTSPITIVAAGALTGSNQTRTWTLTGSASGTLSGFPGAVSFNNVIRLIGGTGNDTFQFNNGVTWGGTIDGGAGTDALGYSAFTSPVTFNLATLGAAYITSVESVIGSSTATSTLVANNTNNTWNLTGANAGNVNGVNFSSFQALVGGYANDTFQVADGATFTGAIDGGAGTDTLNYSAYTSPLTVNLATLVANNIESITGTISAASTLIGTNGVNLWNITGVNAGDITGINFSNFQTLIGGSSSDGFTLGATGSISGGINGGSGGNDSVTGRNVNSTWNITGANAGSVSGTNFSSIKFLFGGTANDTFQFGDGITFTGPINGGAGVDTLNYSAYTSPLTVNLAALGATNVEVITGTTNATSTLLGANTNNAWTISGVNTGAVNGINFNNFQALTGGTANDTFTLGATGSISGGVSGGAGTNTVVGRNANSTWAITGASAGNVSGTNFSSIQALTGGTANDTFQFGDGVTFTGTINGGAGTDTLNYSAFTSPLTVNLAALGATNVESITGTTNATSTLLGTNTNSAWNITGVNAGTVNGTTFSNFQALTGGTANDTFTLGATGSISGGISGGAGTNTVVGRNANSTWAITGASAVSVSGTNFSSIQALTGGTANDTFQFGDGITFTGTINGGTGTDTLNYSAFTSPLTVNLAALGATNVESIIGTTNATSTLLGANTNNAWNITGVNVGDVNGTTFSNFQALTGGTANDTFTLGATGSISGGISGGAGTNTVVGRNANSTWAITGASAVSVSGTNFSSIQALAGGTANDTFQFGDGATFTGTINGGTGTDTLNYSAFTSPLTVNLAALGAVSVESITGTTNATSTLIGTNTNSTWNITGTNTGTINGTTFSNFQALTGGTANDTFQFSNGAGVTGTIAGGAGVNSLNYSAYTTPVAVNLQSNTATGSGSIANIQTAIGGAGSNTLTGTAGANTFNITGANSGTLNGSFIFSAFQTLAGGPADDTVAFNGGSIGSIAGGSGNLTLVGDKIDYTGAVSGSGQLAIQTATAGRSIELSGTVNAGAVLDLTAAEIGQLQNGFSQITIGNSNTPIALMGSTTFLDSTTLQASTYTGGGGTLAIAGGDLIINAAQAITTGDLSATGQNISLTSGSTITTGTLNTSSATGGGGNITLNAVGDTQINTINAQGVTTGGNVSLTSGQLLRVAGTFTDQNGVVASISTAGATGGGAIALNHQGGNVGVSFLVGDASTNGTAGSITSGSSTLAAPQAIPNSATQGNIQVVNQGAPIVVPIPQPSPTPQPTPQPSSASSPAPVLSLLPSGFLTALQGVKASDGLPPETKTAATMTPQNNTVLYTAIQVDLGKVEGVFTAEFAQYLELTPAEVASAIGTAASTGLSDGQSATSGTLLAGNSSQTGSPSSSLAQQVSTQAQGASAQNNAAMQGGSMQNGSSSGNAAQNNAVASNGAPGNATQNGSTSDATQNGLAQNSLTSGRSSSGGFTQNGSTSGGATQDGATSGGAMQGGSTSGSATQNGSTSGGATQGGATSSGSSSGSTTQGGATSGGATQGSSTSGSSIQGGSTSGSATQNGFASGGSAQGGATSSGSTSGGTTQGGATSGGFTQNGATSGGATQNGSTSGGPTSGSATQGGVASNGATQNGTTSGNGTQGGVASNGATQDGTTSGNGTQGGIASNDATRSGTTSGGSMQDGSPSGNRTQNGSSSGNGTQNGVASNGATQGGVTSGDATSGSGTQDGSASGGSAQQNGQSNGTANSGTASTSQRDLSTTGQDPGASSTDGTIAAQDSSDRSSQATPSNQSRSSSNGSRDSKQTRNSSQDGSLPGSLNQTANSDSSQDSSQDSNDSEQRDPKTIQTKKAQARLREAMQATGIKPALLYVIFTPAAGSSLLKSDAAGGEPPPPPHRDDDKLVLVLVPPTGSAIGRQISGVTRGQVMTYVNLLRKEIISPRSTRYLPPAQKLYDWLIKPIDADLQAQKIQNLSLITEGGLRSLPVATLHDGKAFLIEKYSVALMPSINLTDTRVTNIRQTKMLAMGASTFPKETKLNALPAVPTELSSIAGTLWAGESALNKDFTLENLKAKRTANSFGIIHLATHADFEPGKLSNSYIQLSNQRLRIDQIRELGWGGTSPVSLVVLSACRTALGNDEAELGFAGFAVKAGAQSALASLWYVSDEGTLGFMTEFYRQLKDAPMKAEAVRQTQLAMLRGQVRIEGGQLRGTRGGIALPTELTQKGAQTLLHPFFWGAFTLIGSPW